MKLVIVESPAKAKTIQKYLGNGYKVRSSKGHVVDLPKSELGVDVEKDYEPSYVVTKEDVLSDLKKEFKGAKTLTLAVDPDREGEAIGWHVARELGVVTERGRMKSKSKNLERIVFTEITEDAVKEAAENPRKLDMNLVDAQQARRVLDRLVGYTLSPLIWKKVRYGLSAGRVQSVAVRLIVDREKERDKFVADEYWKLKSYLQTTKPKKVEVEIRLKPDKDEDEDEDEEKKQKSYKGIEFELAKIDGKKPELSKEKSVKDIVSKVKSSKWVVDDITRSEAKKKPYAPYSTSALQQDASNKLGMSARNIMSAAQKLYEAGHITYMRTDSVSMSKKAIASARKYITKEFGKEYAPEKPNMYKTSSKVAQEAHEAIRPTNFAKTASDLKLRSAQAKVYDLIRARALASQMSPAKVENNKIIVKVGKYEFHANGRRILFPGYLKLYSELVNEKPLPKLKKDQQLYPETLLGTQHFTQPPPRYSEATLVKELESLGIGRPSTYAPIIHTIVQRKYVDKEGRYFKPTDTGIVVTELLVKHFKDIVDVEFTADMEGDLDDVANGEKDWRKMMSKFYKPFARDIKKKEKEIDKDKITKLGNSDVKCPECGKKMIIKLGKRGRFLSCKDFPDCMGMLGIDEEGKPEKPPEKKVKTKEFKETYKPAPQTEDGRDYLLKMGQYGEFWAHPDYPKVKDAKPLELQRKKLIELYGRPPKTDDGRDYEFKKGRFGPFWAHPDYPKVKDIVRVKKSKKDSKKKS